MSELYKTYLTETMDSDGRIQSASFHLPENFNFAYDVVDVIAKKTPDKRGLVYQSIDGKVTEFTFGQLSTISNQMAAKFLKDGIKKGSKVMLVMKRRYEYWFATLALHKIGAVSIPTSHMVTGEDLLDRCERARIDAVVCVCNEEICSHVEWAKHRYSGDLKCYIAGGTREGYTDLWEESLQEEPMQERISTSVSDHMLYYFTSGTSGEPKAVIHDYSYPAAHIITAKYWHGVQDGGLHFTVADSGWAKSAWGKIYGQWFCECAIMVYDYDQFYANEILDILQNLKVTSFCAPPTIYKYLVRQNLKEYNLGSLTQATTAGEPMPSQVAKDFFEKTGVMVRDGFGQSETTLLTAFYIGEQPKEGSIGRISPIYPIMLVDEDNQPVKQGENGEIVIHRLENGKAPVGIFIGYLGEEERYQEVWDGGFYHTNDLGYMDEDGDIYFVGRNDDVIKSSGYRIGPSEVEDVLMKHEAVFECAVTAYPSVSRGSLVKASIILNKGYTAGKELQRELQDFVLQNAASYKVPRKIVFVDELPRTATGKISRKKIREADQKNS